MVNSPSTRATVSTVAESSAGAQVGHDDPPQGRAPPPAQRPGGFDQGLQVDGPQAGIEGAVDERHGQHGVLERQQIGRALQDGRAPPEHPDDEHDRRDDDGDDGDAVEEPAADRGSRRWT